MLQLKLAVTQAGFVAQKAAHPAPPRTGQGTAGPVGPAYHIVRGLQIGKGIIWSAK